MEEWKEISFFEPNRSTKMVYISNLGRVKRVTTKDIELIVKQLNVRRCRGGLEKRVRVGFKPSVKVHRLVAQHFIPNPENKPIVDHIDFDTFNNNVSNLRWLTFSESNLHRRFRGKGYVWYNKKDDRWISHTYGVPHLGRNKKIRKSFKTEEEANNHLLEWRENNLKNIVINYSQNERALERDERH